MLESSFNESAPASPASGIGGIARATKQAIFEHVHGQNLIYNVCWEDPRLDRIAMDLGPGARVAMIASGGCNALDYLLDDPSEILAVDVNPKQIALLELKIAAFSTLEHEDVFALFGDGAHPDAQRIYRERLRELLSPRSRRIWDRDIAMFSGSGVRRSFFYYGTCGSLAWAVMKYFRTLPGVGPKLDTLLEARTLEEQRRIYLPLEDQLWGGLIARASESSMFSTLLGVPTAQRDLIEASNRAGLIGFIRESVHEVLANRPIADNYFWRGYIRGHYSMLCCPEHLKAENFGYIRSRVSRIRLSIQTLEELLQRELPESVTHFVLLDHQDWMAQHQPAALAQEWRAILRTGVRGATVLARSASHTRSHLPKMAHARVAWDDELAERLHERDRVGTYASFHVGTLKGPAEP
jgi:S-adenosylmethionine-diacylglycerol 3-amino-3-carboxypropyl transferase